MNTTSKELEVIRLATSLIKRQGGFTADTYFASELRGCQDEPGPDVIATCAIGGVEQAIWMLTGEFVTARRRPLAYLESETEVLADSLDETHLVYARVMARLNRVAVTLGAPNVEEVTTFHDWDEDDEDYVGLNPNLAGTLDVFETAAARLELAAEQELVAV